MKKQILLTTLLLITSVNVFAKPLPPVTAPRELTEVGSEFAEGTITRLSEADVDLFIPYAQNAQSVLTKALSDINSMTVQQQVKHLTAVIKAVVKNSGQKNYQTFMRFALNRTLFLVQELVKESDWGTPGTPENVLNIQVKGIELALRFYESDLAYQRKVNQGQDSVVLNHAAFTIDFGKTMLTASQSVLDASAQYRLLYKILEMINWDLSRDQNAVEFSDTIVEIYNTLYSMDENPTGNDVDSVLNIRRLNVLIAAVEEASIVVNNIDKKQSEESARRQLEREKEAVRTRFPLKVGQEVYNTSNNNIRSAVVHEIREDNVILKYPSNTYETIAIKHLGYKTGCLNDYCVGETAIWTYDFSYVKVAAITTNEKYPYVFYFNEGEKKNTTGGLYPLGALIKASGCLGELCVNDIVYNLANNLRAKIIGIKADGMFILHYDYYGLLKDQRGGGWTKDLTKIQ